MLQLGEGGEDKDRQNFPRSPIVSSSENIFKNLRRYKGDGFTSKQQSLDGCRRPATSQQHFGEAGNDRMGQGEH